MRLNKYFSIFFLLFCRIGFSQPVNDICENAIRICPNVTISGTTAGATSEGSDFDFCYTPENTVWFVFTTNDIGGNATVSFSNLVFNPDPTLGQNLQALFFRNAGSCGVTPFIPMSTCGDSSAPFAINEAIVLDPNTTYYVQVSGSSLGVTGPSECTFDITVSGTAVDVPDPNVSISAANTAICQFMDEPIDITIMDCSDTINYEWFYNGVSIFSAEENNFSTSLLDGNGDLELVITCGEFCPKTSNSNILPYTVTPIQAEAGEDQFIQIGEQANLSGSGIGSPTWTPGSSLTSTTSFGTIATPEGTTEYFLTVENNGCFATDSVTVFVGEVITIFSGFSPNNDNINDRWHIINSELFPNMEVTIYDRSGQQVFTAVNYSSEEQWWDGTSRGRDLPVSTYFYVVRLNDENNSEFRGQVNLIR